MLVSFVLQGGNIQDRALQALLNLSVHGNLSLFMSLFTINNSLAVCKNPIIQSGLISNIFILATKENVNLKILTISIMNNVASEGTVLVEDVTNNVN